LGFARARDPRASTRKEAKVSQAIQSEIAPDWRPRELIGRARRETLEIFARGNKAKLFLVIVLDGSNSELAIGLNESHPGEGDGLPFRTAGLTAQLGPVDAAGRPSRPSLIPYDENMSVVAKLRALVGVHCHVLPLRKRAEAAFLNSISVGRARNHDVVLRHASVSKFHGNLEIDDGHLFIKDAGSRNHTFVNHERVLSRAVVRLGDNVRFGWVEALLCDDESLWRALQ
jgi:hypothetical protein